MANKQTFKVSISRNSHDMVSISIVDDASGIEFVDIEMDLATYGATITGLSRQAATGVVRGLEHVGKTLVRESRSIFCPLKNASREEQREWLREHGKEDGWIVDTYLGSQSSVGYVEGGVMLNYSVRKYVEAA